MHQHSEPPSHTLPAPTFTRSVNQGHIQLVSWVSTLWSGLAAPSHDHENWNVSVTARLALDARHKYSIRKDTHTRPTAPDYQTGAHDNMWAEFELHPTCLQTRGCSEHWREAQQLSASVWSMRDKQRHYWRFITTDSWSEKVKREPRPRINMKELKI